jgi:hypothetical protein
MSDYIEKRVLYKWVMDALENRFGSPVAEVAFEANKKVIESEAERVIEDFKDNVEDMIETVLATQVLLSEKKRREDANRSPLDPSWETWVPPFKE